MSEQYGSLFQMLDQRLDKIEELSNDTNTKVAVIESRQVGLISDLSAIKTEIYGNGRPGLKTNIELLIQRMKSTSGTIGAITGGIVAIIVAIVVAELKGH